MVSLIDFMRNIQNATLDDNEKVYHDRKVKDIMYPHPTSIPSNTSIRVVAQELASGSVHALVVADDKVVKGIISTADIIGYFLGQNQ